MKTVVIGGSSGLGRSLGIGLARAGSTVAFLARRRERLLAAAEEAGGGAVAVACDVTDEDSCRSAIEQAADGLGGIDALVYATGVGTLSRIEDLDAQAWQRSFSTNVVGASLVTAAALPYLRASAGAAVYLSTTGAASTSPWPGLAAYTVSKAALDKLVDAWRAEHTDVGFTRVAVGDCAGGEGDSSSEMTATWDPQLRREMGAIWMQRQYIAGALMDVAELIRTVDAILRLGASTSVPSIALTPRVPRPAST